MSKVIDLKKTQDSLVQYLGEMKNLIQNAEILSSFSTEIINASQIKDETHVRQFAEKLPKSGCHIYWIDVDLPNELVKQFNAEPIKADYKRARDNKNTDSKFVYVGSCTKTKLSSRFIQHCGWGNDQTYSLQLRKWLTDEKLTFTFNYVAIEDGLVAQYLEDQLHRDLKPLFGKSGGNNKIVALK